MRTREEIKKKLEQELEEFKNKWYIRLFGRKKIRAKENELKEKLDKLARLREEEEEEEKYVKEYRTLPDLLFLMTEKREKICVKPNEFLKHFTYPENLRPIFRDGLRPSICIRESIRYSWGDGKECLLHFFDNKITLRMGLYEMWRAMGVNPELVILLKPSFLYLFRRGGGLNNEIYTRKIIPKKNFFGVLSLLEVSMFGPYLLEKMNEILNLCEQYEVPLLQAVGYPLKYMDSPGFGSEAVFIYHPHHPLLRALRRNFKVKEIILLGEITNITQMVRIQKGLIESFIKELNIPESDRKTFFEILREYYKKSYKNYYGSSYNQSNKKYSLYEELEKKFIIY